MKEEVLQIFPTPFSFSNPVPGNKGELNFWYYVSRQSNNELTKSCTEYTWDSQQQTFYTDNSATSIEEEGAFAACYNFVNAFNFHNE